MSENVLHAARFIWPTNLNRPILAGHSILNGQLAIMGVYNDPIFVSACG